MKYKKQEAIIKAWGKYWEEVKDNVLGMGTHGGWADNETVHYNEDLGCDSKGFEFENNLYRPKSLIGIENNNGWIAIESKEDLPKETIDCFFFDKSENAVVCGKYNADFKKFNFSAFVIDWDEHITHYQPIIKPLPPIY